MADKGGPVPQGGWTSLGPRDVPEANPEEDRLRDALRELVVAWAVGIRQVGIGPAIDALVPGDKPLEDKLNALIAEQRAAAAERREE